MSYVLPYNSGAYRSFYADEFISSFTHGPLAKGECNLDQAKQMVKCLNEKAKVSSISFNPEMLTQNQLVGGACTAIIFRLARELLPLMRENRVFFKNFHHLIKELEEVATGSKTIDKATQKAIRTEQLALNTITVDRNRTYSDYAVSEKIGAMASYYGLKVIDSSQEIPMHALVDSLASLGKGAYLLRIIQKANNHKLEKQGHSILYLKTEGSEYYFDPALGGYSLFQGAAKANLVYNAALSADAQFGVDSLTVHRLEEEVPLFLKRFAISELALSGITYSTNLEFPVIIFSPALGKGVESYKLLALELVKRRFTVMCVDHLKTGVGTPKLEEREIIKRGLENGKAITTLVDQTRPTFVMGHSLGGSASIEACRHSSKILAAINLDGRIIDPSNVLAPVLQIIATKVTEDRTAYNSALKAIKELIQMEMNIKHEDFSSSDPRFVENLAEECANFFHKHIGEKS